MKRYLTIAFLLLLSFLAAVTLSGSGRNASTYSVGHLCGDMTDCGYTFELKKTYWDFLDTDHTRLVTNDENIEIYVYKTNAEMESDALYIDPDGCSYKSSDHGICVSWVSQPHFYKKGNIIVQYIGDNDGLVSDLRAILGEEFAGHASMQENNQ